MTQDINGKRKTEKNNGRIYKAVKIQAKYNLSDEAWLDIMYLATK